MFLRILLADVHRASWCKCGTSRAFLLPEIVTRVIRWRASETALVWLPSCKEACKPKVKHLRRTNLPGGVSYLCSQPAGSRTFFQQREDKEPVEMLACYFETFSSGNQLDTVQKRHQATWAFPHEISALTPGIKRMINLVLDEVGLTNIEGKDAEVTSLLDRSGNTHELLWLTTSVPLLSSRSRTTID